MSSYVISLVTKSAKNNLIGKLSTQTLGKQLTVLTSKANTVGKSKDPKLEKEGQSRRRQNNMNQIYDYLLVLDFEATCDAKNTPQPQVRV